MEENMRQAGAILADEQARSGNTVTRDPAGTSMGFKLSQLASLRKRHAFLNEYDDELILTTPISTLLKLETTSIKLRNLEKSRDIDECLSTNRDNLPFNMINVEAGRDNRWTELHTSRFLPGMGCSAVKVWLRAREVMGRGGHAPISTYDMGSVGLAGYVTPKGWFELADPGSSHISIRQFSINNCGKKVATKSGGEDDMGDVVEIGEFKLALRALREAMNYVHPWNKSVAALDGFFHQTNFCCSDLSGLEKQAELLAQFTDYVLRENSNKWRGQEPFLSVGELKVTWEAFYGGRPQAMLGKSKKGQDKYDYKDKNKPVLRTQTFSGRKDRIHVPAALWKDDICVLWNIGKCVRRRVVRS